MTFAISVLPTPASPSRNNGRCMTSDRNREVARLRSATYSPELSSVWVSSIDFGCAWGIGGRRGETAILCDIKKGPPNFPDGGPSPPPPGNRGYFTWTKLLQ